MEPFAKEDSPTEKLRVLSRTAATPGLPYITSMSEDAATLFLSVARAIARLSPQDRTNLRLKGIVEIPAAAYLAVPTP